MNTTIYQPCCCTSNSFDSPGCPYHANLPLLTLISALDPENPWQAGVPGSHFYQSRPLSVRLHPGGAW